MSIGTVLREQRTQLGLTVAQAASRGGVTRSYLSMVETGQRAPNPEVLVRFTNTLGIPAEAWLPAFLEDEWRGQRLVSLGRALYETRDFEGAKCTLLKALRISRAGYAGRYNTEIYLLLGRIRYSEGRHPQALRWFSRLNRAVRHSKDVHLRAIAAFNLAQSLARTGRELDALVKFNEAERALTAIRLWPRVGLVWFAKANVLLTRNMYAESHEAYCKAAHLLRGQPFHEDAVLGIAITTMAVHGPVAAVPLLRRMIDNDQTEVIVRAKARDNLATALREMGLYSEAASQVRQALEKRDKLPPGLVGALLAEEALCYAHLGDLTSALRSMDEYKAVAGEKDAQDVAAMRILARFLGVVPPKEEVSGTAADDHEHHMSEALRILQTSPRPFKGGTARRRPVAPTAEPTP